ncbi:MAG: cation:proton antiporter [Acidobacteriaceae bacterium]
MSSAEFGALILFLLVLVASAHLLGDLFARLRQPRVIGEILAGILLGPSLLHLVAGVNSAPGHAGAELMYNIGLLLLMFLSGAETRRLFRAEDRREVAWLALLGTGAPFVALLIASHWLTFHSLMGPANARLSLVLVVGIAAAVTSIPVISRIFHDLGILQTRFARLVLSVAVFEDIALWAVLAVATALAKSAVVPRKTIALEVALTLVYFVLGLTLMPQVLKRAEAARFNTVARRSAVAWQVIVLFAYVGVASLLGVNIVFAAFLAGVAVPKSNVQVDEAIRSLHAVSYAAFIPIYFALVGYKLDLSRMFSWKMLAVFLLGACALKLASVWLAALGAGFGALERINLAIATNARGGPGIVLASVALEAGIISAPFYTTLILTAVITSQAAGWWLEFVMRKGWGLLNSPQSQKELTRANFADERS